MTTPVFTTPPDAPQRLTQTNDEFSAKSDAFAAWLVVFAVQIAIAIQWVADQVAAVYAYVSQALAAAAAAQTAATVAAAASGYFDTLSTNVSCTLGAKALMLDHVGKNFADGERASLVRRSDGSVRLSGLLSASDMPAKTTTLTVDALSPSAAGGPYNDWYLTLDTFLPPLPATVADVRAATDTTKYLTSKTKDDAEAFIVLADASTVAWDASQGKNARVTVLGNRLIGAPTSLADGVTYSLTIVQGAGGPWTPSFDTIWDISGVAFSTTAGKADKIVVQYDAALGKLVGSFRRAS